MREPKPRLGRDAVLAAALELVDRDGYHALTLTSLAVHLDRHVSSLYNHVDGLDGLRRDITALSLEELGDELWRAALGRSGPEGLRSLAEAYRDYAAAHPGRFEAATTWREVDIDPDVTRVAKRAGEAITAIMRSFGLDGSAAAHAVLTFSSAVVGFIYSANTTFAAPPDEIFDSLVALFVDALTQSDWLRAPIEASSTPDHVAP